MARQATAAMTCGRVTCPARSEPRLGTKTRCLWDILFSNPGCWAPVGDLTPYFIAGVLAHIEVLLAGEYVGSGYLDYVADPLLARK